MEYFDYENIARQASIPSEKLNQLQKIVRQEFPQDDMMYELHLLRACMAIQQGHVTIDQAIQAERPELFI
jgi:hypothetical protein